MHLLSTLESIRQQLISMQLSQHFRREVQILFKGHKHTQRIEPPYYLISTPQDTLMSHTLCTCACICLCVTTHRRSNTHAWNNLEVFCGMPWLLWACYLGYDFWQELRYWPRFVKWYNPARLFPFTRPSGHIWHSGATVRLPPCTVCFQIQTPHNLPSVEHVKEYWSFLFFFLHISAHYIFLLTCQSTFVLTEWPSHSCPLCLCACLKAKPAAEMRLGFHFLSKH